LILANIATLTRNTGPPPPSADSTALASSDKVQSACGLVNSVATSRMAQLGERHPRTVLRGQRSDVDHLVRPQRSGNRLLTGEKPLPRFRKASRRSGLLQGHEFVGNPADRPDLRQQRRFEDRAPSEHRSADLPARGGLDDHVGKARQPIRIIGDDETRDTVEQFSLR
jgi:hypothetical protein